MSEQKDLHETCLRCGRKLKSEDSKKLGYGPVCFEKVRQTSTTIPLLDFANRVLSNTDNAD